MDDRVVIQASIERRKVILAFAARHWARAKRAQDTLDQENWEKCILQHSLSLENLCVKLRETENAKKRDPARRKP